MGFLADQIKLLLEKPLTPPAPEVPKEPTELRDGAMGARRMVDFTPSWENRPAPSVEDGRDMIWDAMTQYRLEAAPDYVLLFPMAAGIGKTWSAVRYAHWLQRSTQRRRIFFAGQRHNAFGDVLSASESQGETKEMWLEWEPRKTLDNPSDPKSTCLYEREINSWMAKGYRGDDFCKKICGYDYMTNTCKYHAQKRRPEPIIFGQHAHIVLGHPLMTECDVLIGDENPKNEFVKNWTIPGEFLYSTNMDWNEPLTELLFKVRTLMGDKENKVDLRGGELIRTLGRMIRSQSDEGKSDAQVIYDMTKDFAITPEMIQSPDIYRAGDAEKVDFNFLIHVVPLLARESEMAMKDREFIDRLHLRNGNLEVVMRSTLNDKVPYHMVWFDATGTRSFYESIFGRKVEVIDAMPKLKGRIWQVHDRLNGKGSLVRDLDPVQQAVEESATESTSTQETEAIVEVEATKQVRDIQVIFDVLQRRHGELDVISFKSLKSQFSQKHRFMHFFGNRGSNEFEGTKALAVFGTPMPSIESMIEQAKAIFYDRMEPFDTRWCSVERAYRYQDSDGAYIGNTLRQFMDEQLNVILWQSREAELIQSIHRARPVIEDCDIYLFSSVPIDAITPYRIVSMFDLIDEDAPDGVAPVMWAKVKMAVDDIYEGAGNVTAKLLSEAIDISTSSALNMMRKLLEQGTWIEGIVPNGNRSRGRRTARALVSRKGDDDEQDAR